MKFTYFAVICSVLGAAPTAGSYNGTTEVMGFGSGMQRTTDIVNATGAVQLIATNMTLDGNSGSNVFWAAHLNVTDMLNPFYSTGPSASEVVTNSVIGIDTRGNWRNTSNWETDIIIFTEVSSNATADGQKDRGDCHDALGQQCIQEYLLDIDSRFAWSNTTVLPQPPESCNGRFTNASFVNRNFTSEYADGSAYFFFASLLHNATNTTLYEEAATRIWPIVVRQAGMYSPGNSSGLSTCQMSCLRANATAKGSKKIELPGAAADMRVCQWVVMGIALLAGIWMM